MSKFTSKEVALSFMNANGAGLNIKAFLEMLYKVEEEYEELLKWDDPIAKIKEDREHNLKKLMG